MSASDSETRVSAAGSGDLVLVKRISLKNFIPAMIGLLLANIAWVVAGSKLSLNGWVVYLGGLGLFVVGYLWMYLVLISTEYRLYAQSIEVESGIVARRIENIQLFRVRDIGMSQSVWGRIVGIGNIRIDSTDTTSPHYSLKGVDDPKALYDTLRDLVAKSQATRRTMIVEDDVEGVGPAVS